MGVVKGSSDIGVRTVKTKTMIVSYPNMMRRTHLDVSVPSQSGRKGQKETYNTRDSLVVTDPTTSLAIGGLSMGERTGSRVFHYLWPYVLCIAGMVDLIPGGTPQGVGGCLRFRPTQV